jgi:hypothetical protein
MNDDNKWSEDIESLLEKIRLNCVYRSEYHRKSFYHYKSYEKWFQLPLIILAACNSVLAVSLAGYTDQRTASGVTCLISLFSGIISSVELFLSIQDTMKLELELSKSFYTLSINIYKTLHLSAHLRSSNGKEYLEKCFSQYNQLTEHSKLLKSKYKKDHLIVENADSSEKNDSSSSSGSTTPKSLSENHLADNELLV